MQMSPITQAFEDGWREKVCASAHKPAAKSPTRLLNAHARYRSSCGQLPNAWSAAFCNCMLQHSQNCPVSMLAPHNFCLLVQGFQAVNRLYADLCSLAAANKSTSDSPHSKPGAAGLCGLAACLLQISSPTVQRHDSGWYGEGDKQCWASCAESVLDSCTQLVKQSPACARAMVTVPGNLCCAMLFYAVLCCSALHCALNCVGLRSAVLCCAVLRCAIVCWAALCCAVLCCAMLTVPTTRSPCLYETQASHRGLAKGYFSCKSQVPR